MTSHIRNRSIFIIQISATPEKSMTQYLHIPITSSQLIFQECFVYNEFPENEAVKTETQNKYILKCFNEFISRWGLTLRNSDTPLKDMMIFNFFSLLFGDQVIFVSKFDLFGIILRLGHESLKMLDSSHVVIWNLKIFALFCQLKSVLTTFFYSKFVGFLLQTHLSTISVRARLINVSRIFSY